jgi:hypothetical protein
MHLRPVPDGIVDRRLAKRVDADPSAVDAVGVDAGGPSVSLDQSPRGLAVHVPPLEAQAALVHGSKKRPLGVVPNARCLDIC